MEFRRQDFDADLSNEQRIKSYFYRVVRDVAAFKHKEVVNSYHHVEDFKDADLRKARHEAIEYLAERYQTLPVGFIFPYLSPEQHAADPDADFSAYSHSILFVEFLNDEVFEEWSIAGEEAEDVLEGLEHEAEVWHRQGLGHPPQVSPLR